MYYNDLTVAQGRAVGTVAEEWSLLPPGDKQEEAVSAFFFSSTA